MVHCTFMWDHWFSQKIPFSFLVNLRLQRFCHHLISDYRVYDQSIKMFMLWELPKKLKFWVNLTSFSKIYWAFALFFFKIGFISVSKLISRFFYIKRVLITSINFALTIEETWQNLPDQRIGRLLAHYPLFHKMFCPQSFMFCNSFKLKKKIWSLRETRNHQ